jgi:hypothetical protein
MSAVVGVSAGRTARFAVSCRSGVWMVTRNEAFYGDYLSRDQATRSACLAARSHEAAGGSASVHSLADGALIPHQHADFENPRAARGRSAR